jgi:2-polyprenyl-3-methyl-5-hydroxy-6-metoxy-1,4-benzoquinol methylase
MDSTTVKEYFIKNAAEWVDYGHTKDGNNYPVGKHRNRIVKKIIERNKSTNSILDIGCGGGNLCVDLAKEGYKVKGVDESSEMIKIAKRSIEKLNFNYDISFDKLSLQNISDDKEEYDVITSMGVIGYLDNDDILFDIASRKLQKGGKFIVSCRNRLFNLFPGSKYLRKEIDEGGVIELLNEINNLDNSNMPMGETSDFIESIKEIEANNNLKFEKNNFIENGPSKGLLDESFLSKIRQHTPSSLDISADKFGFSRDAVFGVHPHLLPTTLNNKLPPGLYNQLASSLECWEENPISLIWSSVFISVYTKKGS